MEEKRCFLSNENDCELTDITVDGILYWIKEDIADEYPLKKLKQMIIDKLNEEENKKEQIVQQLTKAIEQLGISKKDLGRLLLGESQPAPEPETNNQDESNSGSKNKMVKEDGFVEVDGELKSKIRANVRTESDVPQGGMTAYSTINHKDEEGKSVRVVETNKRVKKLENSIITKSDFGTTSISISNRPSTEIERELRQVDSEGNLIRGSIVGDSSGSRTSECNLCRGTGYSRANQKPCQKCGGTGFITF